MNRFSLKLLVSGLTGLLLVSIVSWVFVAFNNHPVTSLAPTASATPTALVIQVQPCFAYDSFEGMVARRLSSLSPPQHLSVATTTHLLRLTRLGVTQSSSRQQTELLRNMTSDNASTKAFGEPIQISTRFGARIRTQSGASPRTTSAEPHRDQVLASFAECGLPRTTPLDIAGHQLTVNDLLQDSLRTFDIHDAELTWTATAYALYLPPQSTWQDRDDHPQSIDLIIKELMRRPLSESSCGGTHVLMALTAFHLADVLHPCLTADSRLAICSYLHAKLALVISSQQPDGTWSLNWHRGLGETPALPEIQKSNRLLVTGHLLEWLEYLPKDFQPPMPVYRRAGTAIAQLLDQLPDNWREGPNICPWTHATCAILTLVQPVPATVSK